MSVSIARRSLFKRGAPLAVEYRPPWTDESFTDLCTRCGDCVRACPDNVLVIGDGGFPQVDFSHEGCTLCGDCARVCQASVFNTRRPAFLWRAALQTACLASNNIDCQSCRDACEIAAIRFRPALGRVPQPTINQDSCTGCGACVAVCPHDAIHLETPR